MSVRSERIRSAIEDENPEAMLWDGFDEALVGINNDGCAVYDTERMNKILVKRDNMIPEEAEEFLNFNVYSSYIGEYTPIHIRIL